MLLLEVDDLKVSFATRNGTVDAVRSVSLKLAKHERLGIVGESGSGKSVSSYAILRILDQGGRIANGTIHYDGIDLRAASQKEMRDLRGREISMVFQNPRAALNPIRKVGHQIGDVLRRHAQADRSNVKERVISALRSVHIDEPDKRYDAYPFELSGGMCQRVVIALALACNPRLLIADEPTTGLDVTTQKVVMDLLSELTTARGMSSVLITHDLGLAAQYCDRLLVMKDGEVIEEGAPRTLFSAPREGYTSRLVHSTPRPGASLGELLVPPSPEPKRPPIGERLLEVRSLHKRFGKGAGMVHAVRDVNFYIRAGETVGLVGESGSGKSTTSSMIMRLLDPDEGEILFAGESLVSTPARRFARDPRRGSIQMVFQDATDSLNPRLTAFDAIAEPIRRLTDDQPRARVPELAEQVGLPESLLGRLPHQLSGGQKARVGIARALATRPQLLVLDEPTAALDVSIQAVVLNLLVKVRAELGLTMLFVSHDLHVVRLLCDRTIVMQRGRIVEHGPTVQLMSTPQHAYTRTLLEAVPEPPVLEVTEDLRQAV